MFKKIEQNKMAKEVKVNYNYSKLKGRIIEKYGTNSAFAVELGLSHTSLSMKLNNKVPFSQREIDKACELLGISGSDIKAYFFTQFVQKN